MKIKTTLFAYLILFTLNLFAVDYHVQTYGNDEVGDGSSSAPFATIRKAAVMAINPGDRILIGPGVFTENDGQITIHDGVDMIGSGIDVTIIESNYNPSSNYMRNVLFKLFEGPDAWTITGQGIHGNELAHFTINGFEQLGVAIDARERDNIHFHNFKVMNCYYSAIHVATDESNWGASSNSYYPYWWNKNLKMHDLIIINGGGQVQYDRVYGSEAIKIGNIDGGELWNLYVEEDQGGALICSWNEGWNRNLSIHDNVFVLTDPYGYPGHPEWGNYLNIEFKNPIGLHEIYNNYNENTWWSFVSGLDYWGDAIYDPDTESGLVLHMHDNEVYLDERANYILALELGWGYSKISNNYFYRDAANPNDGTIYGISVTMKDINRNLVHNNILDNFTSGFLISAKNDQGKTRENIYITNNTVRNSVSHAIKFSAVLKPLSGVYIQNNIFDGMNGQWGPHAVIEVRNNSWQPISNVTITNNIYFGGNGELLDLVGDAADRMYDWAVGNNLETDPLLVGAGDTPFPFYDLSSLSSPAVDFGIPIIYEDFYMGDFLGAAPDAGAKDIEASEPAVPITSLFIDQGESMELSYGSQTTLTAQVAPVNASYPEVYWFSGDYNIVSVDRFTGKIFAVAEGQTIITAKTLEETYTDFITIDVTYIHVESVSINSGDQNIDENTYTQLTLDLLPVNADNKNVNWTSSNQSVASVDSNGLVYGVSPGNATIAVISEDGGLSDQVTFTVNDVYVPVSSLSITSTESAVFIDRTLQLTAAVLPVNADNKSLTWSSSDTDIATVDQAGNVSGVAEGNVTITAISLENNSISAMIALSVEPVPPNDLPWIESFTGLADGTELDEGETAWSIIGNASNHLEVINERLEGLRTYNTGVTLVTEAIDIAHTPATISVDISEKGSMEYQDYVKVYYSVDGGPDILMGEVSDDLVGGEDDVTESEIVTILADNIAGNSLIFKVEVYCSGGDEYWFIDNLKIYESGSTAGSGGTDPVAVKGVSLDNANLALGIGSTAQLTAVIAPANATNQSVTWSSSNPSVATVDSNGAVEGIASGSAVVTVTTNDGGYTAQCIINVSVTTSIPVASLYEAEANSGLNRVYIKSSQPNFTGTGYGDFDGSSGAWIEWNNIDGGAGGTATVTARYGNGNSYVRSGDVVVNGVTAGSLVFAETGGWHIWGTEAITVNLNPGANTIRIVATEGNGGPNLDSLEVTVNEAGTSTPISVTGVTLDQTTVSLYEGSTAQLSAVIAPANATDQSLTWSSNNTSVATVNSNGLITGASAGVATITVTSVDGGYTDNVAVTVNEVAVAVTGVILDQTTVSLDEGSTAQLSAVIAPANATDQSLTWSSNNTSVATVNSNGLITGASAGVATITVTSVDGGYTDNVAVTVNEVAVAVTGVILDQTTVSLDEGSTAQLSAVIAPANATDQSLTWSSNNTSVATVNSNGLITGASVGVATITVTSVDGGYTDNVAVTVNEVAVAVTGVILGQTTVSLDEGSTAQLSAVIAPANATDQSLTWSSNNTSVATVNSNGLITGASVGVATITVTSVDGGYTDNVAVTVNEVAVAVTGVVLDQTTVSLDEGSTAQLTAVIAPANATDQSLTWSSNNTSVATVNSNGLITGASAGVATITVTSVDGGYTDNVAVTVNEVAVAVTGVILDQTTVSLDEGSTAQLTAVIAPANATNQSVTWSSSNPSVATVDSNGAVEGIASGSAVVTVTTNDGGYTAQCIINVSVTTSIPVASLYEAEANSGLNRVYIKSSQPNFTGTGYGDFDGSSGAWIEWNNIDGGAGGTATVTARYGNGNSYVRSGDVVVNGVTAGSLVFAETGGWHIWGTEAITVNLNPGANTIRIVATEGNGGPNLDSLEVTVNEAGTSTPISVTGVTLDQTTVSLYEGSTAQLSAVIAPANATDQSLTWSSNNTSVATVNSNGLITGASVGVATITVTSVDGGYTDNVAVTVSLPSNNETIWLEDFNDLVDGTDIDTGDTAWSHTNNASNWFEVRNGVLEGNRTWNLVTWTSEGISISGSNVSLSLDVWEQGALEFQDFVKVYYAVDGNAPVFVQEVSGGQTGIVNVTTGNISGSIMEIILEVRMNGGDEYWFIDNIKVASTSP